MKRLRFTSIIITVGLVSPLLSSDYHRDFSNIFDRSIYLTKPLEISEVVSEQTSKAKSHEIRKIEDPVEILRARKIIMLKERALTLLQKEIDALEVSGRLDGRQKYASRFFEDLSRYGVFRGFGTLVYCAADAVENFGRQKGLLQSKGGRTFGRHHLDEARKHDNQYILKDYEKRKTEFDLLIKALDHEPFLDLEKKYVVKKRLNQISLELQEKVEGAFLLLRGEKGHFYHVERNFIQKALALPHSIKVFSNTTLRKEVVLLDFINRLSVHPKLDLYSSKTKRVIMKTVLEILSCTFNSDGEATRCVRRYFWGKPGCGKTFAAKFIADFLDLPYFIKNITFANDLQSSDMLGKNRLYPDADIGWFLRPLFKVNSEGKTYRNALLIIDDIDIDVNVDTTLSTLKRYLDSIKPTVQSGYFDVTLDISQMHIILTSNTPIPDGKKFAPLKSRLGDAVYEFPKIEPNKMKVFFDNMITEEVSSLNLELNNQLRQEIMAMVQSKIETLDARSCQKLIRSYLLDKMLDKFLNTNPD